MKTWIFPSNPDAFQIENAFQDLKIIDWGTRNNVKNGDHIYIYKSIGKNNPEGGIILKTEVIKENVIESELIDDRKYWLRGNFDYKRGKKYIRVKLIGEIYDDKISSKLSYNKLRKNGLNHTMPGPIILDNNPKLKAYIENSLRNNN